MQKITKTSSKCALVLALALALASVLLCATTAVPNDASGQPHPLSMHKFNAANVIMEFGKGGNLAAARKIVFVHGFPEILDVWQPLMAKLHDIAAQKYAFFAPNQRGFGGTLPKFSAVEDYNVQKTVEDLHEFIGYVTNGFQEKVALVSHDFGGLVSWVYTHKYPETLSAFVVMNCPHPNRFEYLINNSQEQQTSAKYLRMFVNHQTTSYYVMKGFGYSAAIKAYNGLLEHLPWLQDKLIKAWDESLTSSLKWYPANVRIPSSWSFADTTMINFPENCDIKVPTLVFWGMKDSMYIPENVDEEELGAYVSDLTVRRLHESEHFSQLDETDSMAADIMEFLAKHNFA